MDKVMSNKKMIALYVLPALLLILAIVYIPIVLTAYYGLNEWNGIGRMKFVGLDNYAELLGDRTFWNSAWHSLLLAVFRARACLFTWRSRWCWPPGSKAPTCSGKYI